RRGGSGLPGEGLPLEYVCHGREGIGVFRSGKTGSAAAPRAPSDRRPTGGQARGTCRPGGRLSLGGAGQLLPVGPRDVPVSPRRVADAGARLERPRHARARLPLPAADWGDLPLAEIDLTHPPTPRQPRPRQSPRLLALARWNGDEEPPANCRGSKPALSS